MTLGAFLLSMVLVPSVQMNRPTFNAYGMTMSWDAYANQRTWDQMHDRANDIKTLRDRGYNAEKLGALSSKQMQAAAEGKPVAARARQSVAPDTPVMRQMSDEDKQRLYEVMVLMGTFLMAMHEAAPESQEADDLKKAAGATLKGLSFLIRQNIDSPRTESSGAR